MREIKFRAWDKINKNMIYDRTGTIDQTFFAYNDLPKGWELMQYTGLKDKNGKEIYEGDICKIEQLEGLHKVVWSGIGFWFKRCDDGELFAPRSYLIEIIGNVYENPEVLNDTK